MKPNPVPISPAQRLPQPSESLAHGDRGFTGAPGQAAAGPAQLCPTGVRPRPWDAGPLLVWLCLPLTRLLWLL